MQTAYTNTENQQEAEAKDLAAINLKEGMQKLRELGQEPLTEEEATVVYKAMQTRMKHEWAIILAGGRGSRLPIRGSIPKQFAPKFDGVTFIQDIASALSTAIKPNRMIIVVTNPEQKEYAIQQLTPSRRAVDQRS